MDTIINDDTPSWILYAEMITTGIDGIGHNEYFEVTIDLVDDGRFKIIQRWGPRPDIGLGQCRVTMYRTLLQAESLARYVMVNKIREGYQPAERPDSARGAWV
jgi:hypothetical protein